MKRFVPLALITAIAVMAITAAACGGGDDDGGDGGNGAASPTAAKASPTAAATPSNGDGENVFTIVSKNTLFDKTEIEAKAGEITLIQDNQDAGIVHNLHVFKGSDATGEDMGATELEAGPSKQTLKLTLDAGDYFYQCDAHPATMLGTLKVE